MPKTATIKLRLEEDEKANWEAQADADGVTLSSLIRRRMNHPVTRADGVLDPAPEPEWFLQKEAAAAEQAGVSLRHYLVLNGVTDASKVFPVGASSADPPTFEYISTRVGGASDEILDRRIVRCEHGRPHYVYCPTCDA